MAFNLYEHQLKAIDQMHNGCILCGGVGVGKSRTAIAYYFQKNDGNIKKYSPMKNPENLYIITTAHKRDTLEWDGDLVPFLLSKDDAQNYYDNKVVIDSWNNIKKYSDVKDAFFIFDEQRLVGSGAWVSSFYKIAKKNEWILLSATPADSWSDYIPVFVANGFYKNKTAFANDHIVYNPFVHYRQIQRYLNTGRLVRLRNKLLVDMEFTRTTVSHHEDVYVTYDVSKFKDAIKYRWNPYKDKPIQQPAGLCYVLRQIVNTDESRQVALLELIEKHPKVIIFYNFDYERDILINLYYGEDFKVAEWSGHAHESVPECDKWIYLVQYTAGCEGWNCITTDTIIFYSQNYSYKVLQQACGRIDRLNTPYKNLYYYHFKSRSGIDLAISKSLKIKKKFNEGRFVKW